MPTTTTMTTMNNNPRSENPPPAGADPISIYRYYAERGYPAKKKQSPFSKPANLSRVEDVLELIAHARTEGKWKRQASRRDILLACRLAENAELRIAAGCVITQHEARQLYRAYRAATED